jgi:calmodulin
MDFEEYMLATISSSLQSPENKLNWMFDVFDKDGGGSVSAEEIQDLLQGLFQMSGQEFEDEDLVEASEDIMNDIDADGDGEVTKHEFIKNAMKSQFIAGMLS